MCHQQLQYVSVPVLSSHQERNLVSRSTRRYLHMKYVYMCEGEKMCVCMCVRVHVSQSHSSSSFEQLLRELVEAVLSGPGEGRGGVVPVYQHVWTHCPTRQQLAACRHRRVT